MADQGNPLDIPKICFKCFRVVGGGGGVGGEGGGKKVGTVCLPETHIFLYFRPYRHIGDMGQTKNQMFNFVTLNCDLDLEAAC